MNSKWLFLVGGSLVAALLMALVMHLSLRRWRRSRTQAAHWTEQARFLWQARRAQFGATLGIMGSLALTWVDLFPRADGRWWLVLPVLGLIFGTYPSAREMEPRYTFWVWLKQTSWTLLVQFGMVGIFLGLMFTMPQVLHLQDWLRAGLGIAAIAAIVSGVWMPLIVRLFPETHPQEARLDRLVAEASAITGVKPRHAWLAITPVANAAALIYIKSLVVTTRMMEDLQDDEVRAVILHEMAHLRERLLVQIARLVGMLSWTSLIFIHPMVHRFEFKGILILLAGVWLVNRLARALARRLENEADSAAIHGTHDPAVYAHALEKLYIANQLPAVMRGRQVHPHLYDRMVQAGVTPAYPRPLPPGPMAWPGWAALALPAAMLLWKAWERWG